MLCESYNERKAMSTIEETELFALACRTGVVNALKGKSFKVFEDKDVERIMSEIKKEKKPSKEELIEKQNRERAYLLKKFG